MFSFFFFNITVGLTRSKSPNSNPKPFFHTGGSGSLSLSQSNGIPRSTSTNNLTVLQKKVPEFPTNVPILYAGPGNQPPLSPSSKSMFQQKQQQQQQQLQQYRVMQQQQSPQPMQQQQQFMSVPQTSQSQPPFSPSNKSMFQQQQQQLQHFSKPSKSKPKKSQRRSTSTTSTTAGHSHQRHKSATAAAGTGAGMLSMSSSTSSYGSSSASASPVARPYPDGSNGSAIPRMDLAVKNNNNNSNNNFTSGNSSYSVSDSGSGSSSDASSDSGGAADNEVISSVMRPVFSWDKKGAPVPLSDLQPAQALIAKDAEASTAFYKRLAVVAPIPQQQQQQLMQQKRQAGKEKKRRHATQMTDSLILIRAKFAQNGACPLEQCQQCQQQQQSSRASVRVCTMDADVRIPFQRPDPTFKNAFQFLDYDALLLSEEEDGNSNNSNSNSSSNSGGGGQASMNVEPLSPRQFLCETPFCDNSVGDFVVNDPRLATERLPQGALLPSPRPPLRSVYTVCAMPLKEYFNPSALGAAGRGGAKNGGADDITELMGVISKDAEEISSRHRLDAKVLEDEFRTRMQYSSKDRFTDFHYNEIRPGGRDVVIFASAAQLPPPLPPEDSVLRLNTHVLVEHFIEQPFVLPERGMCTIVMHYTKQLVEGLNKAIDEKRAKPKDLAEKRKKAGTGTAAAAAATTTPGVSPAGDGGENSNNNNNNNNNNNGAQMAPQGSTTTQTPSGITSSTTPQPRGAKPQQKKRKGRKPHNAVSPTGGPGTAGNDGNAGIGNGDNAGGGGAGVGVGVAAAAAGVAVASQGDDDDEGDEEEEESNNDESKKQMPFLLSFADGVPIEGVTVLKNNMTYAPAARHPSRNTDFLITYNSDSRSWDLVKPVGTYLLGTEFLVSHAVKPPGRYKDIPALSTQEEVCFCEASVSGAMALYHAGLKNILQKRTLDNYKETVYHYLSDSSVKSKMPNIREMRGLLAASWQAYKRLTDVINRTPWELSKRYFVSEYFGINPNTLALNTLPPSEVKDLTVFKKNTKSSFENLLRVIQGRPKPNTPDFTDDEDDDDDDDDNENNSSNNHNNTNGGDDGGDDSGMIVETITFDFDYDKTRPKPNELLAELKDDFENQKKKRGRKKKFDGARKMFINDVQASEDLIEKNLFPGSQGQKTAAPIGGKRRGRPPKNGRPKDSNLPSPSTQDSQPYADYGYGYGSSQAYDYQAGATAAAAGGPPSYLSSEYQPDSAQDYPSAYQDQYDNQNQYVDYPQQQQQYQYDNQGQYVDYSQYDEQSQQQQQQQNTLYEDGIYAKVKHDPGADDEQKKTHHKRKHKHKHKHSKKGEDAPEAPAGDCFYDTACPAPLSDPVPEGYDPTKPGSSTYPPAVKQEPPSAPPTSNYGYDYGYDYEYSNNRDSTADQQAQDQAPVPAKKKQKMSSGPLSTAVTSVKKKDIYKKNVFVCLLFFFIVVI